MGNYADRNNLTDDQLYYYHWYKELRTPEERRILYAEIVGVGIPPTWARRVRDWSLPHQKLFIENYPKNKVRY